MQCKILSNGFYILRHSLQLSPSNLKNLLTGSGLKKTVHFYNMANQTSQHILTTSVNLLGFCLLVITSLHITDRAATTFIDEFISVIAMFLTFSCFFSFFSLRSKNPVLEKRFETAADYLFMISLTGILLVIVFLVFNFVSPI